MFGVGWTEMLVIGVVALIVIGPKDLPVVMNRIGKVIGTIRRMGGEFQREINKTTGLDQITDIRRSITEPLKKTASEIRSEFNKVTPAGATVPSGVIAPKTAGAESVVAEIHEKIGTTAPVMLPLAAVESPAPVEAIAPAAKPARKPRAKKTVVAAAAPEAGVEAVAVVPAKPKAPRKPRAAKPKAEA